MTGTCKLCGMDKELQKQSHIIPNFMFKTLMPEGFMYFVKTSDVTKPKKIQTGFFERYILCGNCDNAILGNLESYASHILYGTPIKDGVPFTGGTDRVGIRYLMANNYDHTKLKLAFLSILWRSHLSTLPFFSGIDIGEKNAETLRTMILNNDAGSPDDFKVTMMGLLKSETEVVDMFVEPVISKFETGLIATFFINGFIFWISIDPKASLPIFDKLCLKQGTLMVYLLEGELGKSITRSLGIQENIVSLFFDENINPS